MMPPELKHLLTSGRARLPLPGSGRTAERFERLADWGRTDLVMARLGEAHTDAVAIAAELGGGDVDDSRLWGVWAAQGPTALVAWDRNGQWYLTGEKPWCSGATICDGALVTASAPDGARLFAIDPGHERVSVLADRWVAPGMAGSLTRDLRLDDVPARAVGGPGAYLDRPGFWWGAAGVAAVWAGGAERVALALRIAAERHGSDLLFAALARVDAAQHAARSVLRQVGDLADTGAADVPTSRVAAMRCRAVVETAVELTLHETARQTGPAPLVSDAAHSRHVADLQIYLRQSHGDRDLATLGRLLLAHQDTAPSTERGLR